MTLSKLVLIGGLVSCAGCAGISEQLPEQLLPFCEAPIDLEAERLHLVVASKVNLLAPNPVLEARLTQQTLSARTLNSLTPARTSLLTTWQIPHPRCEPLKDDPVPMASGHALVSLLLRKSGAGRTLDLQVPNACWAIKLQKADALFSDSESNLFCDSLDPKLVLSTKERAERDAEPCDEDARNDPTGAMVCNLFKVLSVRPRSFYEYRYMNGPLSSVAIGLLEEHKARLPPADRALVQDYSLAVVYDTDKLFVEVDRQLKAVLISAPVLRVAFVKSLERVTPALDALRTRYLVARKDERSLQSYKVEAIESIDKLSTDVLKNYSQMLAFIISHELAHIYRSDLSNEYLADCFGVANMVEERGAKVNADIFNLIVEDYAGTSGAAWHSGDASSRTKAELQERRNKLIPLLDLRSTGGVAQVKRLCGETFPAAR